MSGDLLRNANTKKVMTVYLPNNKSRYVFVHTGTLLQLTSTSVYYKRMNSRMNKNSKDINQILKRWLKPSMS